MEIFIGVSVVVIAIVAYNLGYEQGLSDGYSEGYDELERFTSKIGLSQEQIDKSMVAMKRVQRKIKEALVEEEKK